MTYIEKALIIACNSHLNQKDKAGRPYIEHVLRVYSKCQTDSQKIVALLHDVVEDTHITINDLKSKGFTDTVINAIDAITKVEGVDYSDYLLGVKKNDIACFVKIKDLKDNMNLKRLQIVNKVDEERLNKYVKALKLLEEN